MDGDVHPDQRARRAGGECIHESARHDGRPRVETGSARLPTPEEVVTACCRLRSTADDGRRRQPHHPLAGTADRGRQAATQGRPTVTGLHVQAGVTPIGGWAS